MSGSSKANQRQNTRHKAKYNAYRLSETREKNKARKLLKHQESHPTCETTEAALDKLPVHCVKFARKQLAKDRVAGN